MSWHSYESRPPRPGVFPVRVPHPVDQFYTGPHEKFARWTGEYWCNWAPSPERAARCQWRGPSYGYLWWSE